MRFLNFYVSCSRADRCTRVFATRLGTSQPHWLPTHHRYEWDRFAAATTPRLPTQTHQTDRVRIPWPKVEEPVRAQRQSRVLSTSDHSLGADLF